MRENTWKAVLSIAVGVILVVALGTFTVQSAQNKAFAMEEQVTAAKSDIKIQEKRRVDLVYNLADCVKQYDEHEAETFKKIVSGREATRLTGENELKIAFTAVSEAYPELKSDTNYQNLMSELSITENIIAEYRGNYNKQVKAYNRYVRKFPARVFLDWLGYEKQEYPYLEYDASEDAPQGLFGE